jgi:hypothetical protein
MFLAFLFRASGFPIRVHSRSFVARKIFAFRRSLPAAKQNAASLCRPAAPLVDRL